MQIADSSGTNKAMGECDLFLNDIPARLVKGETLNSWEHN